jgi:diaminopimelate decarboxylase
VIADLLAEHGSPLWLVDLDRVRERLRAFHDAWARVWPDVEVAYSYKTNRQPAILRAVADEGAGAEVVCEAEYAIARDVIGVDGPAIVVNGPAKPPTLIERAAADGALIVADSAAELAPLADAGAARVGLRVALPGVGVGVSRFGIDPGDVAAAFRTARALGLTVEALSTHLVSTGFARPPGEGTLAGSIVVAWPPAPDRHAGPARLLAGLARELGVGCVDLGGGHPAGPALAAHAEGVARALRERGFAGRLLLEPGRAVVADAVDLALTVAAVKRLADGSRCVIVDGGTNLLAGALWGWPAIEPVDDARGGLEPTLVTGPLCLNVDVLAPAAPLPADLAPGDVLVARGVGAYHQSQSTAFGEARPAVAAREDGRWRLVARGETIADLIAGDLAAGAAAGTPIEEERP